METCPDGQTCPPTRNTNSTCTTTIATRYANEPCDTANACATGLTCTNGYCKGVGAGEKCTSLYQCDPGYFCQISTLTCTALVETGGACTIDYDCQIDNACDNKKCVQYFSLQNGAMTTVGTSPQGFSMTCGSGYARQTGGSTMFQCEQAPKTSGTAMRTCKLGDQCGSDSNSGYTKPCTCGYTALGESYCPYFEGDEPLQHAIGNYTLLLSGNDYKKF